MKAWLGMLCLVFGLTMAQAAESPQVVVRDAADDLFRALHTGCPSRGLSASELYAMVDRLLLPYADFRGMSRWVLGKHWKRADQAQREAFVLQFKQLLVRTYAAAVQQVSPEQIVYLPERQLGDDKAVVRTEVRQPGAQAVTIDYHMYRKTGRWLVFDVRIEGVSLVTNYRTSFAAEISAHGVQGLIDRLQQKNAQPSSTDNLLQLARAGDC